ncbi:Leucine efflux protein [Pigmentiphaga humi]|uniref:Leucine efflux protein n=1 Tax=Pigmentiphaga humi TaxID=2478468 RepID=A0A3P4AZU1_9BURK|nr:LysE family translocator [Pigmentiphaga humi]VCU69091.1 Leucine efflux protein [Pigmentiphaga humi]
MQADLLLFLSLSVGVTVAPGPDNLQVLARSLSQGRAAGIAAALGFASGCLFHTMLAVLGVAALLKASPLAFDAIRLAGAAYLLWLAVQVLRNRGGFSPASGPLPLGRWRIFGQSVLANMLNPKVTLFFLVFLPQFVSPWAGHPDLQMFWLGVLFMLQAAVVFCLIAWFAGMLGEVLRRRPQVGVWLDRLAGVIFLFLAVRIVWN